MNFMPTKKSAANIRLTEKDKQLLALLQKNAREPAASLARKIGVSRTTLQERLHKLENSGVIGGYSIHLNTAKLASTVTCFTFVLCNNKSFIDVVRQLKAIEVVQAVHAISGDWDLMIKVSAESLEQINAELNRINAIEGIERTTSNIVMETKFDRQITC